MPLKNAPEHRPIADSSRLTATWRNRESAAKQVISGVIQPSGKLATSEIPHAAAVSATFAATGFSASMLCSLCGRNATAGRRLHRASTDNRQADRQLSTERLREPLGGECSVS